MGYLPRPAGPRAFLGDLRAFLADGGRYRLVAATVAIGMTSLIVTGFIIESRWGVLPEGPQITYAEDFPATRTDDQIKADQKIDQAQRQAAARAKQEAFQRVAKRLGIE